MKKNVTNLNREIYHSIFKVDPKQELDENEELLDFLVRNIGDRFVFVEINVDENKANIRFFNQSFKKEKFRNINF